MLLHNCTNPKELFDNEDKLMFEMVFIEGGTFEMGDCWDFMDEDALPTHLVKIDPFYMLKYEVTVRQYKDYARSVGIEYDPPKNENLPVTNINWNEAKAFCDYYGYRLPSEAEWEYAARSGGKNEWYSGTNAIGDEVDEYIVHLANSGEHPHSVGTKKPNSIGLYDMTGNVYEWIGEYYAKYEANNSIQYTDLSSSQIRIIRGGCYSTFPIKNYQRTAVFLDQKSPRIGFRCVQSINK
jgi:formylglycine-generating enzyme required for sulfatase activity